MLGTLHGTVTDRQQGCTTHGRTTLVVLEDAPDYLREMWLVPSQMKGAKPGDRVEMEYHSTGRYGLWKVVGVTREAVGVGEAR